MFSIDSNDFADNASYALSAAHQEAMVQNEMLCAANDYFHHQLTCRLFPHLIND